MNKNDIISAVSIEFGLSKEQTEITVNNIFINIAQSFKKNKVLEIQKFGKFKLTAEKDSKAKLAEVRFSPSKKLSVRVNSKFDNLKKTKIKLRSVPVRNNNPGSPVRKNEELPEIKKSDFNAKEEPKEVKINTQGQRKLISDDLVKLHKEITKEDRDDSTSANNLWG